MAHQALVLTYEGSNHAPEGISSPGEHFRSYRSRNDALAVVMMLFDMKMSAVHFYYVQFAWEVSNRAVAVGASAQM